MEAGRPPTKGFWMVVCSWRSLGRSPCLFYTLASMHCQLSGRSIGTAWARALLTSCRPWEGWRLALET